MTGVKPLALQLCAFGPELEAGLGRMLDVVRWFELGAEQQASMLASRAGEVRSVITGGHIGCPSDLMSALPGLGLIAINGVGYDKVDLELAAARGVRVSTTPDVLTTDVADLAVGLTIDLMRGITLADRHVRDGKWPEGDRPLMHRVSGRRFGVVGLGRIGRATADRLAPFGSVRYHGPLPKDAPFAFEASIHELARWADVLVLTCQANEATRGLIDSDVLAALGPDGFLVNVARGSVVDEPALIQAIREHKIAGAALDVFAHEPHVPSELIASDRVVLTPHIASASTECRAAMRELVLDNVRAFLAGHPLPSAIV
ncbi:2-hydroxyacid dehydrogenase [Sphingopyxis sp. FD7]|uniref:2-hydroxyacid dehydrogenase n=1 Tax=Sphingopyxis sp. FD7 TaxID=1914525 RepID=UPI000DC61C95|nr:2-hydroxyacid dehydrogenase [Sphingopyxis sp. FD7]BBB14537.1 D-2-hydroxyacid dehydrogensase protein [Sphingopyxis sp. FD7]